MARKQSIFLPDDGSRGGGPGKWIATGAGLMVLAVAMGWFVYVQFRIDVGTGEMAILTAKTGKDLKNSDEIAPGPGYKGVQPVPLTEGRYFYNPFNYDWQVIKQREIANGKIGVLVSLTGDDLPYGEFLAKVDKDGNPLTKGIVPGILNPGRHPINPYLFELREFEPITIPAGFKGVVTNLAGPMAKDANQFLVPKGSRGVQEEALEPGTYPINPFEQRISLVDCRSQRLNVAEQKDMGFPSKDGFWVSLDGIVEFRIKPERAAEIYVTYNEIVDGTSLGDELVRKVILPNARSFCRLQGSNELGREFLQGRSQFEENFESEMRQACAPLGIEIIQAVITGITPPEKIAEPVRAREIAKQEELQYQQQILQQESEQKLAIEKELVKQKQALVQAQQSVVKVTTEAEQQQKVAVTKANEKLKVAEYQLEAARDEAAATLAKGKGEADVIRFQNEADAAGWKTAVDAFGGEGNQYARYVLLQKLAPSYRNIMANTADSPIMRVFEMFTQEPGASPGSPARTAGAPVEGEAPVTTRVEE